MTSSGYTPSDHKESIISQFTKQAIPYSRRHNIYSENEIQQLVELTKANKNDAVLDLACGPGYLQYYANIEPKLYLSMLIVIHHQLQVHAEMTFY